MVILTSTRDLKIDATNHLIEMSLQEYANIAGNILKNNTLQRKRVASSNKLYSLLKSDILSGCVIPPIVLGFFAEADNNSSSESADLSDDDKKQKFINKIQSDDVKLLILDGLQRTYTILDLLRETPEGQQKEKVLKLALRIELYSGISKVGVLYRMLTLNTGQTPMSMRQQIEMLYSEYKNGVPNLTFFSEADNRKVIQTNEYRFSDVLDQYLSYITGDYVPIDREDILDFVKNLEALTSDDKKKDIFSELIQAYHCLREKFRKISNGWVNTEDIDNNTRLPFISKDDQLFSKVQVMAGFGAAISFLQKEKLITGLANLDQLTEQIALTDSVEFFERLNKNLEHIKNNAKKIGNDQRMFFYYLIRNVYSNASDSFLDLDKSIVIAMKNYQNNI